MAQRKIHHFSSNSAGPLSRRDDEVLPALLEPFRIATKEDFHASKQGPRTT